MPATPEKRHELVAVAQERMQLGNPCDGGPAYSSAGQATAADPRTRTRPREGPGGETAKRQKSAGRGCLGRSGILWQGNGRAGTEQAGSELRVAKQHREANHGFGALHRRWIVVRMLG